MGYSNNNKGMPSYISPINGEQVIAVARPSKLAYIVPFIFGGWFVLGGIYALATMTAPVGCIVLAIGAFILLKAIIQIMSIQHTITNKRVISKRGLISARISEVWINDIRGINFSRTIWQTIIRTGNIVIGTAATGGAEIVITDVANAKKLVDAINSLRSV